MANPMSALDEIRELQRKTLKYAEPVYQGFPVPERVLYRCLHEAWASQSKRTQEEMRYDKDVRLGVDKARMAGIWSRLCRRWASKHDRRFPHMPGGY